MSRVDVDAFLLEGLPLAPSIGREFVAAARFTDFCAQLGVTLEHGQRVAALVAYDGLDPCDLIGEERETARELFGDVETIAPAARRIFAAVAGARGGKTYALVALRMLHLALTVDLSPLAPGEYASGPIIAPDMDLAQQALRFVQGAVMSVPALAAMVDGKPDAEESICIRRGGKIAEIVVRAASGRGRTGRGRTLFGFALSEAAFFLDKNYKVNDNEIFLALRPRLTLPGSQGILESTPWSQTGLLYDLFVANHPDPTCAGLTDKGTMAGTALAMHAPTLALRDTPETREFVHAEETRDPENAAREFGAQFMSASTESFFDPVVLAKCLDDSIELPTLPQPGDQVMSGVDLGFTKNSSALVISHMRAGMIRVAQIVEKKPQEGASLKPSEVCREFADEIVRHHGSYFMADGHYKETALEEIGKVGLGFLEAPSTPADAFLRSRAIMREDRVRLPNHPRLVRQLRETLWRRGAGGNVTIILPKWRTGEHGDLASAFVLSIYQQTGERMAAAKPPAGTPEADALAQKEAQDRRRKEAERRGSGSARERWRPRQR